MSPTYLYNPTETSKVVMTNDSIIITVILDKQKHILILLIGKQNTHTQWVLNPHPKFHPILWGKEVILKLELIGFTT